MNRHAHDAFAPLGPEPAGAAEQAGAHTDQPTPVLPVPPDAHAPGFKHSRYGEASAFWQYRDRDGRLLGYVARFDGPDGKQILPRTWCRLPDGSHEWHWKAFPAPRPLYGLNRLAARPDAPVLVVEGEKTADAAERIFPNHVPVAWPGGSSAVGLADWTALSGRDVLLWPDADGPGRKAMAEVARQLRDIAGRVHQVPIPGTFPMGWDLAGPAPPGTDLLALLEAAAPLEAEAELPPGYVMTRRGLVWRDPSDSEKPDLHLCGPIDVLAETRDADGGSWGVLLRWRDNDGRIHRWALPRAMLAGDGADARRMLLEGGLFVAPGRAARERLTAFLVGAHSPNRVTATLRIGWHGSAYVLPDQSIGAEGREDLLLQGNGAFEHAFRQRGTLHEWQDEVARYAVGNSRLLLALSAAFAAALVGPCDAESGGVHLIGSSSTGKSTALAVAGSVWGGGEPGGYVRSWRATANGLEGVALGHCDALLCLDELSQLASREAGEVAYMLANGAGKSRSARDGTARRAARWRVLFLSSGEIGLADKVAEDGRKRPLAAGQQVRIVDVRADAGAGLGLFEDLHGFPSAEAFARHLRTTTSSVHGVAARTFLAGIAGDLASVRSAVKHHVAGFVARHVPPDADGQVLRVAQRFGLIAAAGEIAVTAGVLPWAAGAATGAAARCFRDWLDERGGVEPAEIRNGLAQVRSFLLAHGMSRFLPAWDEEAKVLRGRSPGTVERLERAGTIT